MKFQSLVRKQRSSDRRCWLGQARSSSLHYPTDQLLRPKDTPTAQPPGTFRKAERRPRQSAISRRPWDLPSLRVTPARTSEASLLSIKKRRDEIHHSCARGWRRPRVQAISSISPTATTQLWTYTPIRKERSSER